MLSWQARLLSAYFRFSRFVTPPPKQFDYVKERAYAEALCRWFKPLVRFERQPLTIGTIPAEWLTPSGVQQGRTLLYIHGGGFVAYSINTHRSLATNIAHAGHARALIIEYGLAPEHPFPAGLQDCLASYRWLLDNGIQPQHLVVAGDSAGGNLTLALLVRLRDLGLPLPAAAVCLAPATDLTLSGESFTRNARADFLIDQREIEYWLALYLCGHDPCDPLASPLYADLHGLPPLLLQVGDAEMLFSDSTRFAEKARLAGVDVTLEVMPQGQHVQQMAANLLPEARQAIQHIGQFIDSRLGHAQ